MIVRNAVSKAAFNPDKMGKVSLAMTENLFAGLNTFEAGQEHKLHTHQGQDKIYFVLRGAGEVAVGEEQARIEEGDLVVAEAGEEHALRNPGPGRLVVMVLMAPPPKPKAG
jgi:quercetin dioxygenase-like cupin family protein